MVVVDSTRVADLRRKSPAFAGLDALHAKDGGSFSRWLADRRAEGRRSGSYQAIAREIDRQWAIEVSPYTVRLWCLALGVAAPTQKTRP